MDSVQGVQRLVLDYPGIYLDLDLSEVEEVDETGILFLHGLKRRVIAIGGRITLHSVSGGVVAALRRSDMDGTLIGTFE